MSLQDSLNAAKDKLVASTADIVASTTALQAATAQLVALNIPAPVDAAPLLAAIDAQTEANTALAQAVTDNQTAVTAEATKINQA